MHTAGSVSRRNGVDLNLLNPGFGRDDLSECVRHGSRDQHKPVSPERAHDLNRLARAGARRAPRRARPGVLGCFPRSPDRPRRTPPALQRPCNAFRPPLQRVCNGEASEHPRTHPKPALPGPAFSGLFAPVRGPSRRMDQSGRPDLNRGPHRPERCALPGCATPRSSSSITQVRGAASTGRDRRGTGRDRRGESSRRAAARSSR
jgi:hypothetical protein